MKVEAHHGGTEDTEDARRDSGFEISNLRFEILRAPSVYAVSPW
jgi:hypothetical protein